MPEEVIPPDLSAFVTAYAKHMAWRKNALCLKAGSRAAWFTCGEDDSIEFAGRVIGGRQAQILATQKYCADCDVQWDCALWAVEKNEVCGVWGMTVRDLLWMQRLTWADLLLREAKTEGTPVHVVVRKARECAASIEDSERVG